MVSPVLSRGKESFFSACTFAEVEVGGMPRGSNDTNVGLPPVPFCRACPAVLGSSQAAKSQDVLGKGFAFAFIEPYEVCVNLIRNPKFCLTLCCC